jgi:hypothetical protein
LEESLLNHILKKVIKGVRWMPWLSETMKDVISCDKPRGGANNPLSVDFRMGKPDTVKWYHSAKSGELTRRTETSKYPEEKKTIVIPLVVAIERGIAQTLMV